MELNSLKLPDKSKILDSEELQYLGKIEILLNTYEKPILKGETLVTPQIEDFTESSKLMSVAFVQWESVCQDKEVKEIIEFVRLIMDGLLEYGQKDLLSETEMVNLKNIFNKGGDFLVNQINKIQLREKSDEQVAETFLEQFFVKISTSIRKSENENIKKFYTALESMIKELNQQEVQQKKTSTNSSKDNNVNVKNNYIYTGYPKNARINMTSNGIGVSLSNGELRYTKLPQNISISMDSSGIRYFSNGIQVFPVLISEEEAVSLGATKPKINENGTVNVGNNIFAGNSVYSGGNIHIGDVVGGVNFKNFGESAQEEVVEGGKIVEGNHDIDITKIKNLDRIGGGTVTIRGNGIFNLGEITGGNVKIQSGVTVHLGKITGGEVNITIGAKVVSDLLTGGRINGKDRIIYQRNTGAIIN